MARQSSKTDEAWEVSQIASNVHRLKFNKPFLAGDKFTILLTGDRHADSARSALDLQKEHLARAKELHAPIIDVGDFFDLMQARGDMRSDLADLRGEHKRSDYIDAVIDSAAEWFGDYAHLFAVIGTGNHETKVLKYHHINPTRHLCDRLRQHSGQDWPFAGGYGGYVIVQYVASGKHRTQVIKYYHGSGGGGEVTRGVIKTNRNAVKYPDADVVVMGHIHEAWDLKIKQERITQRGGVHFRIQHHVSIPSYKRDFGNGAEGWHVERGGPPKPIGCTWMHVKVSGGGKSRVYFEHDAV